MNFNLIRPFLAATEPELGTTFAIGRPWLFLVLVPALILAIIPFFRLHKSRRYNVKHVVPLIIHILILVIATALITDINIIETAKAPEETEIIVVADMSDSNSPMKDEMNQYIKDLQENADENTEIAVIIFANDTLYYSDFGEIKDDYLAVTDSQIKSTNTNIQQALEFAQTQFSPVELLNKRVVLLSDGRQTIGNSWSAATKLSDAKIRLDAAYFNVLDKEGTAEVQMLSMVSTVDKKDSTKVTINLAWNSTKATSGTIQLYEVPQGSTADDPKEDIPLLQNPKAVTIKKGNNVETINVQVEGAGIHAVYAVIEPSDEEGDTIEPNNTLYSWFEIDAKANILLVDGDGKQVTTKITSMLSDYDYTTIETVDFPSTMEELLAYDEVVLMNINFADMPAGATDLVKRYVQEVGRGVVFTCGSNTYNYNDETYADNPLIDILPVDLKIDERREVIATVITVDLSSSMGQEVTNQTNKYGEKMTRYDMVLASVLELIDPQTKNENGEIVKQFADEDYIGVVFFDSDASVALPLTQLYEKDWIIKQVNYAFESYFYYHTDEKNPSHDNRLKPTGGTKDANGYSIKSYGTNYKFGIDASNTLLSESDADLKQLVFLSDGEPSDKNSGYDNTIRRMASAGVTTSTVAIGRDQVSMLDELSRLAAIGHGNFNYVTSQADLSKSLVKIAEMIKGKPINERETKLEKRNDGAVLVGVNNDEFDVIDGYYGTTIKDGAKIILSADDLRPIIAEWDIGLGHATVYMSDLGGVWSRALFNDEDGFANSRIVKNLLVNSLNDDIGSSGLKLSSERIDDITRLTIETQRTLRDTEQFAIFLTDKNGNTTETYADNDNSRLSATKYRVILETPDETGTYSIEVKQVAKEDAMLYDRAEYAIVGFYPDEYNLLKTDGEKLMEDLVTAGDGEIMADAVSFYDIQKEEFIQFGHNISTPSIIVLLLLFIVDLLFRHFSPKKKDKKDTMTEAERAESMRGR